MAGIWGVVGQNHSIAITHWDGDETLHPVAYVYDHSNTLLNTLNLVHRALGYYSVCWCPTTYGVYNIVVITYNDSAHTIINEETQREGRTYFINDLLDQISNMPENVADAVWDEKLPGEHDLPHSSGLYMQVIRQTVLETQWEIRNNLMWSLPVIEQKIMDTRAILQGEINDNEVKIDALSAQAVGHHLNTVNEIQLNRSTINAHDAHLSMAETNIIGEINENEIKIDSILTHIQNIQNNTRFIAVVPAKMRIPQVGTNTYQFFLAVYDIAGAPAAPDHAPRVRIVKSDGTVLMTYTNMIQDGGKTGQYYFNYNITSSFQEMILRIEFEVVENSVTTFLPRVSEIVIFDSDLSVIENKIDILDTNVDHVNAQLSGGNGLGVINTKLNTALNEINQNETLIAQVKTKTDLIISNPTDKNDINLLENKIAALPTITQIQSRLDTQSSYIKGPDNRNLTQVYDNEKGTDNALLANDPRLSFLDAAISSRSGHTVSDIWNHVTRTLTTSAPLSEAEVAKIWDYLVTNITTSGSIGKYILDMVNVPISTRSTLNLAQLTSALAPLALEASVSTVLSSVINENNENQLLIQQAIGILNQIKPRTDKIVNDGARHNDLVNEINQNENLIIGLELLINNIKSKTDLLHGDLAHQSSVLKIPINPLLANDGRLAFLYYLPRLDVLVSTRAESFPNDYAKAVSLEQVKNQIVAEININEAKINQLPTSNQVDTKLVRLDNILVNLSDIKGIGFNTLLHSLVKIKEGQNGESSPAITPQQIWAFANRTLTQSMNFATPADITNAKNEIIDVIPEHRCHMTTTFVTQSDIQEVLCWLDRDGQTITNTINARIVISDGTNDIWNGSRMSPDSRGVYRITKSNISSLISTADKNFIISITINYNGKDYKTVQPFYTVG